MGVLPMGVLLFEDVKIQRLRRQAVAFVGCSLNVQLPVSKSVIHVTKTVAV